MRTIKTVKQELDAADRRLQQIWGRYDAMPQGAPDNPKLDAAFDEAFTHRDRLIYELARLETAARSPRQGGLGI